MLHIDTVTAEPIRAAIQEGFRSYAPEQIREVVDWITIIASDYRTGKLWNFMRAQQQRFPYLTTPGIVDGASDFSSAVEEVIYNAIEAEDEAKAPSEDERAVQTAYYNAVRSASFLILRDMYAAPRTRLASYQHVQVMYVGA
jgi:hypothetical protein